MQVNWHVLFYCRTNSVIQNIRGFIDRLLIATKHKRFYWLLIAAQRVLGSHMRLSEQQLRTTALVCSIWLSLSQNILRNNSYFQCISALNTILKYVAMWIITWLTRFWPMHLVQFVWIGAHDYRPSCPVVLVCLYMAFLNVITCAISILLPQQ